MLLHALTILCLATGCALPWHLGQGRIPDVKPLREERAQRAIADFERHRNRAEWEAAQLAYAQGQTTAALGMLDNLLRRDPRNVQAVERQLELLVEADQLNEGQHRAELARDHFPDEPAIQRACALVFEARGERELAAACLRRAGELAPRQAAPGDAIRTLAAEQQPVKINSSFAVAQSAAVVEVDQAARSAALWKSTLAEAFGIDDPLAPLAQQEAIESTEAAVRPVGAVEPFAEPAPLQTPGMIDIRPLDVIGGGEVEGWLIQAEDALRTGREQSARIYLQRALAQRPGDAAWSLRVASLPLRHAQPELSADLAQRALERHPNLAALHTLRGLALYRQQQYAGAQSALERSLALDNSQPLAYFLLGCTLSKQGQRQAAEEFLRQARHLDARYR